MTILDAIKHPCVAFAAWRCRVNRAKSARWARGYSIYRGRRVEEPEALCEYQAQAYENLVRLWDRRMRRWACR